MFYHIGIFCFSMFCYILISSGTSYDALCNVVCVMFCSVTTRRFLLCEDLFYPRGIQQENSECGPLVSGVSSYLCVL